MKEEQLRQIKKTLDDKYQYTDAATASRLRQAREQALEALDKKPVKLFQPLPTVFAAVTLVLMSTFFLGQQSLRESQQDYQQVMNAILLEDSLADALLTDEIDIEFYENMEFYQWLQQVNKTNQG